MPLLENIFLTEAYQIRLVNHGLSKLQNCFIHSALKIPKNFSKNYGDLKKEDERKIVLRKKYRTCKCTQFCSSRIYERISKKAISKT